MAKWVHADVLDGGLNAIQAGAIRMALISSYTAGDSYATVIGNRLAEVTMASGDFTKASSGSNRTLTTAAGKSATATGTAGGTPDLHIAFHDNTGKVLWITDETSNQPITTGNTVNFPQLVYTSNQPT